MDEGTTEPAMTNAEKEATVESLQESIKQLLAQRNELRDKLRRGSTTSPRSGGAGENATSSDRNYGRNFPPPLIPPRDQNVMMRGRRFSDTAVPSGVRSTGYKRGRESLNPPTDPTSDNKNAPSTAGETETPELANGVRLPAGLSPDELRVEKRPKVELDGSTMKRHKNLLGSLIGHLKKAKETLDLEQESKQSELQREKAIQVDQKLLMERQNLAERRRTEMQAQKKKHVEEIKEVQKEIIAKDIQLLRVKLENHYKRMTNFIRTRAEPPIFWLPAVHTSSTIELQGETRQQIAHKVALLREQFGSEYISAATSAAYSKTPLPVGGTDT